MDGVTRLRRQVGWYSLMVFFCTLYMPAIFVGGLLNLVVGTVYQGAKYGWEQTERWAQEVME